MQRTHKTTAGADRVGWLAMALFFLGWSAQAQFTSYQGGLARELPDGGGTGVTVQQTVSGFSSGIQSITVRLDISGTWTGDLYAYLNFGGAHAVLLNRAGTTAEDSVGYGDPGLQVRLRDDAPNGDIHRYRLTLSGDPALGLTGPLMGDWAPDGRTTDPEVVGLTDARSALLGSFRGMSPNGVWALFVADLAPGSVHHLDGWGLEITLIPEPSASPLVFGITCVLWAARRGRKGARRKGAV